MGSVSDSANLLLLQPKCFTGTKALTRLRPNLQALCSIAKMCKLVKQLLHILQRVRLQHRQQVPCYLPCLRRHQIPQKYYTSIATGKSVVVGESFSAAAVLVSRRKGCWTSQCGRTRAEFAGDKKVTCSVAKGMKAVRQCAIKNV